jgi:hypothetical protein
MTPAMTCLLFPGRHHLLTNFQLEYLTLVTSGPAAALTDVDGRPLGLADRIDTIIWAVTSANHAHTRRNPLPAHRREAAIEELADLLDAASFVYHLDDIGATPRFAEYTLKKIEVDSQGRFRLTPANTVVACSTPEVLEQYERLGFRILPVELADRHARTFAAETPWQLMEALVKTGRKGHDWRTDPTFLTKVARATRRLYLKYNVGDEIIQAHLRPLLTEDGDITATRDYNTYVRSFDEGARRKYDLIRDHVLPGRIADIGCCTGSLIREMTQDDRLRESDFYGIEAARRLYVECLHRKEQGLFANDNVFFYQRDFAAGPIFPAGSINTFTTVALTHEVESYLGRASLLNFFGLLKDQLAIGGRWINLDVLGPEEKDQPVLLRLNRDDGRSEDWDGEFALGERDKLRIYLDGLSTFGRFLRFARDFRRQEGYRLKFQPRTDLGEGFVSLSLFDACEFLSKRDYTDNWESEMHESFCFWSFGEWKAAVEDAGFRIHPASRAFANPWLIENRYRGKADLFRPTANGPAPLDYPVTNMVLVAERI